MQPFERIFKLHRLLTGHRSAWPTDRLCEELACSRATLKRIIKSLRDGLGAPLEYDRDQSGYRYTPDIAFELPGLWFSAQELAALLLLDETQRQQPLGLLADALQPLRPRLEKLAVRGGVGLTDWRRRLRLTRMGARPAGPLFDTVASATLARRKLSIDYHGRGADTMQRRSVSPQRLTLYRENWYLEAWCHLREGLRMFALDRIIAAEPLPDTALELDPKVLEQTFTTSYGIFSGTPDQTATLRFTAHAASWVAAECWHPQQQDTRLPNGGLERQIPFHRSEELVMDLLRHGPEVEVMEPDSLRQEVRTRLHAALQRYETPATAPAALRQAG